MEKITACIIQYLYAFAKSLEQLEVLINSSSHYNSSEGNSGYRRRPLSSKWNSHQELDAFLHTQITAVRFHPNLCLEADKVTGETTGE